MSAYMKPLVVLLGVCGVTLVLGLALALGNDAGDQTQLACTLGSGPSCEEIHLHQFGIALVMFAVVAGFAAAIVAALNQRQDRQSPRR